MPKFICIVCPRGCHLEVDENNKVTGNFCKRGETYAITEMTNPTRMITSTIKVKNGMIKRVPVATSAPIPKNRIFDCMAEINKAEVEAPVVIKQKIITNVLNLGIDIVSTRNIDKIIK